MAGAEYHHGLLISHSSRFSLFFTSHTSFPLCLRLDKVGIGRYHASWTEGTVIKYTLVYVCVNVKLSMVGYVRRFVFLVSTQHSTPHHTTPHHSTAKGRAKQSKAVPELLLLHPTPVCNTSPPPRPPPHEQARTYLAMPVLLMHAHTYSPPSPYTPYTRVGYSVQIYSTHTLVYIRR